MFQPWRLKLREVQEAVKANRLDEARVMLREGNLAEFRPAKKVMEDLGNRLATRGRNELGRGETLAGWRDLEAAEQLGVRSETLAPLRDDLVAHSLAEAEKYLAIGDAGSGLERLDELQRRGMTSGKIRELQQIARKVARARDYSREGRYRDAERLYAAGVALRPDLTWLEDFRVEAAAKEQLLRGAREDLHRAMAAEDWTAVVTASEAVLDLAPHDAVAGQARTRAWKAVGAKVPSFAGLSPVKSHGDTKVGRAASSTETEIAPLAPRFLLWVDGVGGYLVCEGDDLVIGQPASARRVDIPILGDLSQREASIRRCGEGYLLIPNKGARLNGRTVAEAVSLADRAVVEVGNGVRLIFRQPHPYSNSATLQIASTHRTQPTCDGIILMADSVILGAETSSHVVCRDWPADLVLFKRDGELYVRSDCPLEVNGAPYDGETPLPRNAQVVAEQFSMSVENLSE